MLYTFLCSLALCTSVITQAAEVKRTEFCTFIGYNDQKHKSRCWFHENHKDVLKITKVKYRKKSKWRAHNTLDDTDKTIANQSSLPYQYEDIVNIPDTNVYVLKSDYYPKCNAALEYLTERLNTIRTQVEPEETEIFNEKIRAVRERIQYYMNLLTTENSYRHTCPGLIVPKRAVLCAIQWSCQKKL